MHWVPTFVYSLILVGEVARAAYGSKGPGSHSHGWLPGYASAWAFTYALSETLQGEDFLEKFAFEAIRDPTHGRVNYVNESVARSGNLVSTTDDTFILKSDSQKVLTPGGPGRDSVRLISKRQYETSVMVFDVRHMPQGCGTWPAIWTVGDNWPNQGELDLLEGVNDQGPNQITIHTGANCKMPKYRLQTGTSSGNNCDVAVTNNAGCGVKISGSNSYGLDFNTSGGGWIASEKTDQYVKVWFWPRDSNFVPHDIRNGARDVDPRLWGIPAAYFPSSTQCNVSEKFGPQRIIINLTFCGDWAGAVYGSSGCPSTCVDFVNNNPSAFSEAYFDIASLRIYE